MRRLDGVGGGGVRRGNWKGAVEGERRSERKRRRVSGAGLSEGPCHIRAAPVSSAGTQHLHSDRLAP